MKNIIDEYDPSILHTYGIISPHFMQNLICTHEAWMDENKDNSIVECQYWTHSLEVECPPYSKSFVDLGEDYRWLQSFFCQSC